MRVRSVPPGLSFRGFATVMFLVCSTSGWVQALDASAPAKPRFVLADRMEPGEPENNCHHVFTPAAIAPSAMEGIFWVMENPNGTHADSKMQGTSMRILTPESGTYRIYAEERAGGKKAVITNVVEIQFTRAADIAAPAVRVPVEKARPVGGTPPVSIPAGGSSVGGVPAEHMKPLADVQADLVGVWLFTLESEGWSGKRIFKPNGSVIEYVGGKVNKSPARWEIVGDKIKIHHSGGKTTEMFLPLDPKGTKVIDWKGKMLNAIKQ